jgi:hypothetical protein
MANVSEARLQKSGRHEILLKIIRLLLSPDQLSSMTFLMGFNSRLQKHVPCQNSIWWGSVLRRMSVSLGIGSGRKHVQRGTWADTVFAESEKTADSGMLSGSQVEKKANESDMPHKMSGGHGKFRWWVMRDGANPRTAGDTVWFCRTGPDMILLRFSGPL